MNTDTVAERTANPFISVRVPYFGVNRVQTVSPSFCTLCIQPPYNAIITVGTYGLSKRDVYSNSLNVAHVGNIYANVPLRA